MTKIEMAIESVKVLIEINETTLARSKDEIDDVYILTQNDAFGVVLKILERIKNAPQ